MGRPCTICIHPEREAINAELIARMPYRSVAQHFVASPDAVFRHRADHLPVGLLKAQAAAEVTQADNLLDQVRLLQSKALALLVRAEQVGDLRAALLGIREARSCLELLARLQGELDEHSVINVNMAAEWPQLRSRIVLALEPFPEARSAVLVSLNGHAER